MRTTQNTLTFSATDLVNFLGCRHAIYLDVLNLKSPQSPAAADPFLELLKAKGLEHERIYLQSLRNENRQIADLSEMEFGDARVVRTQQAMADGVDVIYQGALQADQWMGYADFLIRVPGRSTLGDFNYEPVDTKLSSVAKPHHALQLAVYARLLEAAQGVLPSFLHIVLGDSTRVRVRTADLHYYAEVARRGLESFIEKPPSSSIGEPCSHCANCRWSTQCQESWTQLDHLSLVAGITKGQRAKLVDAGIATVAALAAVALNQQVPGMQPDTLTKIRSQAALQVAKRHDGQNHLELLPGVPGKGSARLPAPNAGDLFFDMEGDPLFVGGLEYLFGFVHVKSGKPIFTPFWGHDRAEEKRAFEQAVDFIGAQLAQYRDAYIYHYASYEESALKRLAMLHGTREAAVDHLLRTGRLVDLYQVVRESIRVSEPSYSIKNLEAFYMEARGGEVKDAGSSVVVYERWRQLRDPAMLQEISAYNEFDCVSTWKLRDWLLSHRPDDTEWFQGGSGEPVDPEREARRLEAEQRSIMAQEALARGPASEAPYRELVGRLLEFHRREAKPAWWSMFARQEMSEQELIDGAECIGALRPDPDSPAYAVKKSTVHTFLFPVQDFKMKVGDRPKRADTLKDAGEIVLLDEDTGQLAMKLGPKGEPFPAAFSLIPTGPLNTDVQREALYRFAQAIIDGHREYGAVRAVLTRKLPRIRGRTLGLPLIPEGIEVLSGASQAIAALDESYMLVQGPPGTGKTYLSAHVIVDLLVAGRRIGVTSNSHKVINNLLTEIEHQAILRGIQFRGAKKCSGEDDAVNGALIEDVYDNAQIAGGDYQLIGGTAWLFSRPEFDQTLDYLFIDEAGQVALANVVAMGLSARNIVLVGDQMQLAQPAQGVHPGDSGKSALEFLLGELTTVPDERGIFLAVTRRMHPDVCKFISEAIYDGRLEPQAMNRKRCLMVPTGLDPAIKPTGVSWVSVTHEDCSQRSPAEALRIRELYTELLELHWQDQDGSTSAIGPQDILVVSPYNMQVNHLKSILPTGARVGTVDKFQGQEAAVVLVSMTTSTAADIARGLEFLYSRNRLNVAISRAKCLAIVAASPQLLAAGCPSVEQLKLVNTLCFANSYATNAHTDWRAHGSR